VAVLNLKSSARNAELMKKGRWVDLSEGGEVLVASTGTVNFRTFYNKIQEEYRRPDKGKLRIRGTKIPPETSEILMFETVINTVLLDWRGFENDGEVIPCTLENKRTILNDDQYRWIYNEVVQIATDEDAYRKEALEDDAGNLETASGGTSDSSPSS
jgi:hypothetical protein